MAFVMYFCCCHYAFPVCRQSNAGVSALSIDLIEKVFDGLNC